MFFVESQIVFGVINMVATIFLLLSFMFLFRSLYALILMLKAGESAAHEHIFEKLFLAKHLSDEGKKSRKFGIRFFLLAVTCFIGSLLLILLFTHSGWK